MKMIIAIAAALAVAQAITVRMSSDKLFEQVCHLSRLVYV